MSRVKLIILLIFSLCFEALPQSFPVQAGLQIVPPYSTKLADYVAPGSQRIFLNAFLTDINRPNLDVRLQITIEGQGVRLQTRQDYFPSPITLSGGIATQLTALDLEPYFRAENLIIEGLNRQQFINSGGTLPEGVYRFCVEVLEFNRGVRISNQTCVTAWLILNDPPFINVPSQGEKLRITDPQYITFQWTPRHTGSPNSAFSTVYEFSLVEIWPEGRNPNDAILTSPPIFETTTASTTVIYGPSEPALVPGREYAFRVRAISEVGIEQIDLFRNDGFTQAHMFKYGDACLTPPDFEIVSTSSRKIELQWQGQPNHTQFTVRYRETGKSGWNTEEIFFNDYSITGLTPDTEYEIQVGGICGFLNSEMTPIAKARTEAVPVSEFSCGTSMDEINLENVQPIERLQEGDVIYAGDFDVSLTKVSGGNGTFSGEGIVVVPFMNHVKVGVAFQNIKVNDEARMYEGKMHFTALTGQVLTDEQLESIDDLLASLEDFEEKLDEVLETTEEVVEEINEIIETIQETEVFEEEEYEELLASSEEELVEKANEEIAEAAAATASGNVVEAAKKVARAKAIKNIAESKQQQRLSTDTATVIAVEFIGTEDYGFDPRPGHGGFDLNYQKIVTGSNDNFVPWASVEKGQSNQINARWISNSGVKKEDITFTIDNQPITGTETGDGWTFDISSGEEENFHVLKAIANGAVVGKIPIMTYKGIDRTVVLVSVNGSGSGIDASTVETELNDIYGEAAVTWKVETASASISDSEWDLNSNGSMFVDENNDLSAYPDEAKAFIRAFKDKASNISNDKYYLFLTDVTNSSGVAGFMPRKKQFGFIFTQSGGDNLTIAHELGHGAFRLQHVWEESPNISQHNTDNLMDYGGGNSLNKHQWDQIHDPKWVVTLFDAEDEAAGREPKEGKCVDQSLLAKISDSNTFFDRNGKPVLLEAEINGVRKKGIARSFYASNEPEYGRLFQFVIDGKRYTTYTSPDGSFLGYAPIGLGETSKEEVRAQSIELISAQESEAQMVKITSGCDFEIIRNGNTETGKSGSCSCETQETKCDDFNVITEVNESLVESLRDKLSDGFKARNQITTSSRQYGSRNHLLFLDKAAGLDDQKLEILEEKLFLLKAHTGIYMAVAFIDLQNNTMYDQQTAKALAGKAIEAAELEDEKVVLITVPHSNYESILWEHPGECLSIGFEQTGGKFVPFEYFVPKGDLFNTILTAYAGITKPYYLDYAMILADGSLVTTQLTSTQDKSGLPFINNIRLFTSPYKAEIDAIRSKILNDFIDKVDNRENVSEAFEEFEEQQKELNRLLAERMELDLISVETGNLDGWVNEKQKIGKFRESLMRDKDLVQAFLLKETGNTWAAQISISLNLSEIKPEHLYEYDVWVPIDEAVYQVVDAASFIPLVSDAADAVGLLYSSVRGNTLNASIYAAGLAIPVAVGGGALKAADNLYFVVAKKIDGGVDYRIIKKGESVLEQELNVMSVIARSKDEAEAILNQAKPHMSQTGVESLLKKIDYYKSLSKSIDELIAGLKSKTPFSSWPQNQWDEFLADFSDNVTMLARFDSEKGLADSWKYFKNGNVTDEIRTSPEWLGKLSDDLNNPKYTLNELFDESPNDVVNVWKQLKDDPSYAWEISKTGNARWQKWSQREFFKEVTALGKRFEEVSKGKLLDKSSDLYTSLKSSLSSKGLNIDDFKFYEQVQLKYAGDDYFVGDIVLIRQEVNAVTGQVKNKAIVLETKLRQSTNLTTPQTSALGKVKGADPSLVTRSGQKPSLNGGSNLNAGTNIEVEDFIKVWGDGTGEVFSGLESLL